MKEPDDINAYINKLDTLSPVTRKTYIERVRVWETGLAKGIFEVIKDAKASIKWVKDKYKEIGTQKTLFSVILSIYRHIPEMKTSPLYAAAHKLWLEEFKRVDAEITKSYETNEPSQKQRDGYVPFDEIKKKRDKMKRGSMERLLLAMYTYIRPLRADFNRVRLYKTSIPAKHEPNYIEMKKSGCKLHLEEFKTSKIYGTIEVELPSELCKEIQDSLDEWPRMYLFVTRSDAPYTRPNSFVKWANTTLQKLFAPKPVTLTMLRHSYINTLDFNEMTVTERKEEAAKMGHSKDMQELYKLHM